jgi:hypothetical protein
VDKFVVLCLLLAIAPLSAQRLSDDELRADLQEKGYRLSTKRAVLYFDREGLTPEQCKEFTTLVDHGVRDVRAFLKLRPGKEKLEYFVSTRVRLSHTSDSGVFLPLRRVAEHTAPYLHEATHVLVPSENGAPWLAEGFASYVESHVSEKYGGYAAHVFNQGGNRQIDQEATERLATDGGKVALNYIGADGVPRGFYYDRERVAAPYYVLAQSFVKFLVERAGMKQVLALHKAEDSAAALAAITGKSGEAWRTEWLASLETKRASAAYP